MNIGSIIVAAGSGNRFGAKKQFAKIKDDRIVLDYSVELLKGFGDVVVVVKEEDVEFVKNRYGDGVGVTRGGKERMDSVYNGINALKSKYVLIHDAARPLIDKAIVQRLIDALKDYEAVICAYPVFETIKHVEKGFALYSLDRSRIFISQTPQGFLRKKLIDAMEEATKKGEYYSDEAGLWEKYCGSVKVVEGARTNIKITTKEDIEIVRCLLG